MTIVLRKKGGKTPRGRPYKTATYVARRWLPVALHYQSEYMIARLEKAVGVRRVSGKPSAHALKRTAEKFHLSVASVRRAIKLLPNE